MAFYECVFIARQDLSATAAEALGERFAAIIKEQGGNVPKREYWGLRSLAYKIKKNRKGHYVLLNIDASPAAVEEMQRQMRINEDVLRFLTVRVDALEEEPSVMMQARASRDERPRRGERAFGTEEAGGLSGNGGERRAPEAREPEERRPGGEE